MLASLALLLLPLASAQAADVPAGEALYRKHCSACHDAGNRAPNRDHFSAMTPQEIDFAMSHRMKSQARDLSASQRRVLAEYLGRVRTSDSRPLDPNAGKCAFEKPFGRDSVPLWNGWGNDAANTRFQTASTAKLDAVSVGSLRPKWAVRFPGSRSLQQPTILGDRLFTASNNSYDVSALDLASGCTLWSATLKYFVRAAMSFASSEDSGLSAPVLVAGDQAANVYALDARTGDILWTTNVESAREARITGAPLLYRDRIYVPVASHEEELPSDPHYECCRFRGSPVALDLKSGKIVWKSYTIAQAPRPTRKNASGTQLWGPAGAGVWSAPTLDLERRALYVATGNDYIDPGSATSDALVAFDMDTGRMLWSRQFAKKDSWNFACQRGDRTSCAPSPGQDKDFGASPLLRTLRDGRRLLIVIQKTGAVYAVDPDTLKIVWSRLTQGTMNVKWGLAADQDNVYVPETSEDEGGVSALRLEDGKEVWRQSGRDCGGKPCGGAFGAAVTALPGVVFAGSYDGRLLALSSADGRILWDFDTARPFKTVNGLVASGGSIGVAGPVVANGMVFARSGDDLGAEMHPKGGVVRKGIAGNLLFAFSLDGELAPAPAAAAR